MKWQKLTKHLIKHNCFLLREGANHSIYQNPKNKEQTTVGRHNELSELFMSNIIWILTIVLLL